MEIKKITNGTWTEEYNKLVEEESLNRGIFDSLNKPMMALPKKIPEGVFQYQYDKDQAEKKV